MPDRALILKEPWTSKVVSGEKIKALESYHLAGTYVDTLKGKRYMDGF